MRAYIKELVSEVLRQVLPGETEAIQTTEIQVTYPKPEFGDYATNAALLLYPKLDSQPEGGPPGLAKHLAGKIKELDHKQTFEQVSDAGGFINFTLAESVLIHQLREITSSKDQFGSSDIGNGRTIIVEYFQNNVAKPPHVGHLRSAAIGDSLLRILKFLGFKTISDTHIGDWGVQFGILIHAFKTMGDRPVIEKDPINELNKLYVEMSAKIETDPTLRELGKAEFAKLETGDKENRELWQWFVDVSLKDFERYRQLLNLLPFDNNLGESFYEDHMPAVLKEFQDKGLVVKGEAGELFVDLEDQGLGRCILYKSDGASTYHMRDFATYIYRKNEFDFHRNLYVVDNRQSHHFRQLFAVLEKAGYPAETDSVHVDFGFMSLPEGAMSTRKGNAISLRNLIDEAHKRALAIINEKNPDLANKELVAAQVALAAIKYFDLSHNRQTNITFTWDSALSFDGNTGPYLQYTHARIHGILRKANYVIPDSTSEAREIRNPDQDKKWIPAFAGITVNYHELAVMRRLFRYPEVLEQINIDYLPSHLAQYLFELAQLFNVMYENVPVTQEPDERKRGFRLQLIAAIAQAIKNGLNLLGIEAPEEM